MKATVIVSFACTRCMAGWEVEYRGHRALIESEMRHQMCPHCGDDAKVRGIYKQVKMGTAPMLGGPRP